jgi:hypothetical protein
MHGSAMATQTSMHSSAVATRMSICSKLC